MFSKIFFSRCTGKAPPSPSPSSVKLQQSLEVLEQKEIVLQKKISIEVERAKEFTRSRNKEAAIQCLKRKKYYEGQMEQVARIQLRIHDQQQKLPEKLQVQHEKCIR